MIKLNVDLGERADEPEELYALAHLVNVACGGHAGDAESMHRACELARKYGAQVGAHPSYEDRARFGRVELALPTRAVAESVERQCRSLVRAASEFRVPILHLKLHGALYHSANRDSTLARAVVDAARNVLGGMPIIGPPAGALSEVARSLGLRCLREGFADRHYLADGRLAPRSLPNALVTDPAMAGAQALRLARDGRFDTLCVHGDTPDAVSIARAVRRALDAQGQLGDSGDLQP